MFCCGQGTLWFAHRLPELIVEWISNVRLTGETKYLLS